MCHRALCVHEFHFYHPHMKYDGKLCLHNCLSTGGTPWSVVSDPRGGCHLVSGPRSFTGEEGGRGGGDRLCCGLYASCKSKFNSLPDLCKSKFNSLADLCKAKFITRLVQV